MFDGYRIVRELHGSSRSHIYLAVDIETDAVVTIKIPSIDLRDDPAYLKRFMMEEWVARRIDSPHVLKPCLPQRKRNFLYVVTEYIDGQTLTQWMIDNPEPDLETVRGIVEQIAKGLRAFHRKEMLHQDIRPDNIMIDSDRHGEDHRFRLDQDHRRRRGRSPQACTTTFSARCNTPRRNIFSASAATSRSDLFSLGVITYQMLTGRLPYGAQIAQGADAVAVQQAGLPPGLAWRPRDPAMGRRHARRRPCIPIPPSAMTACRNSCSTCVIPTRTISRRHRRR